MDTHTASDNPIGRFGEWLEQTLTHVMQSEAAGTRARWFARLLRKRARVLRVVRRRELLRMRKELRATQRSRDDALAKLDEALAKLDDALAKLDDARAKLRCLQVGPLAFFAREPLSVLPCPACTSPWSWLSAYPYATEAEFARLIVCWCDKCGMGWVPDAPFGLDAYYARAYGASRDDRKLDPQTYFREGERDRTRQLYFERARAQLRRARRYVNRIDTMLDYGAGPGYALHVSQARTRHAIEPDERSWPLLKAIGAEVLTLDRLDADRYDLVLCSHSLEHLLPDTLAEALTSFRRALAPEGVVQIEVPPGNLLSHRRESSHTPHTLFFSPESLLRLLERFGFEVLHAQTLKGKAARLDAPPYVPKGAPFVESDGHPLVVIARKSAGAAPRAGPVVNQPIGRWT